MQGRGRPKKDAGDRKDCFIAFRATWSERRLLEKRAKAHDLKLTPYVYQMALMDPEAAPKRPERETERKKLVRGLINQLSWLGNNMNQVATVLNTTGDINHKRVKGLESLMEQIEALIREAAGLRK
mgnify:FL=1